SVIGQPREVPVDIVAAELLGIDTVIGLRSTIAEMRILAQRGLDDAGNRMPESLDLCKHLKDTVPHLLNRIGNPVRAVHFDRAGLLVHGEFVPLQVERAVGESQVLNDLVLALGADIIIAGVVPSADIQPGNVLAGLNVGGWYDAGDY